MNTVLFDIGNVLATDFWEALWLTRGTGLADRLGVPVSLASEIGSQLWDQYSTVSATESDYWADFERLLGQNIAAELVEESESVNVTGNPRARPTMLRLRANQIRIGVISNNTSFWAPKQLRLAGVCELIDSDLLLTSSSFRADKTASKPNLFVIAAGHVDAKRTLVVDDRLENIATAQSLDFETFLYGDGISAGVLSDGYYRPNVFSDLDLLPLG